MSRIFKIAVLFAALTVSCRVQAPVPVLMVNDLWACRPDVIAAMNRAWIKSGNGYSGTEAGFRIDVEKDRYVIVDHDFTNEQGKLTAQIEPWTIVEFHLHPNNGGPMPSTPDNNFEGSSNYGDTKVADEHFLDIYTFNNKGLYVYRWQTKQIMFLRPGLDWSDPCVTIPQKKK
jgi:hypothetical protein